MNPLELQILVLLSRVPETDAGTVLAYEASRPVQTTRVPDPPRRPSAARLWSRRVSDLSGQPRHELKSRWLRSAPMTIPALARPARLALNAEPFV
ncbi:MAG: hypothetical protein QM736_06900 [Vicinamibacterales bacterium]